jgi:hypothetical protein
MAENITVYRSRCLNHSRRLKIPRHRFENLTFFKTCSLSLSYLQFCQLNYKENIKSLFLFIIFLVTPWMKKKTDISNKNSYFRAKFQYFLYINLFFRFIYSLLFGNIHFVDGVKHWIQTWTLTSVTSRCCSFVVTNCTWRNILIEIPGIYGASCTRTKGSG